MEEAEWDLETAEYLHKGGRFNAACFYAQQSAEKAVKAVFQKMHVDAWGHSVADLLGELSKTHEVPKELMDSALELDKAYISARYPNAHPSGSPRRRYIEEEARRFVEHAEKILRFCSDLLSKI